MIECRAKRKFSIHSFRDGYRATHLVTCITAEFQRQLNYALMSESSNNGRTMRNVTLIVADTDANFILPILWEHFPFGIKEIYHVVFYEIFH